MNLVDYDDSIFRIVFDLVLIKEVLNFDSCLKASFSWKKNTSHMNISNNLNCYIGMETDLALLQIHFKR